MADNTGFETSVDTIFIAGLPEDTTEDQLAEHFGQIGIIKFDKKNDCKKIWIYKDKATGKGKGEATITYDDPHTATSAINWFNGKDFRGGTLKVELAQRKAAPQFSRGGFRGGRGGGRMDGGAGGYERGGGGGGYDRGGPGRGGGSSGRPGDWLCPSCSNNNFAYRNECNRCKTQKPASAGDESGGGGGPRDRDSNRDGNRDSTRDRDRDRGGSGSHYNGSNRHHGDHYNSRGGGGYSNRASSGSFNYRDNDHRDRSGSGRDGGSRSYRDSSGDGGPNYNNRDRDRNRDGSYGGSGPSRSHMRGNNKDDRRQRPY